MIVIRVIIELRVLIVIVIKFEQKVTEMGSQILRMHNVK